MSHQKKHPPENDPDDPAQYRVLCINKTHTHIDDCWLSGWMAGHAAGYAAAREDAGTRLSLREAQAQIAELKAHMAEVKSQIAWSRPEGGADD